MFNLPQGRNLKKYLFSDELYKNPKNSIQIDNQKILLTNRKISINTRKYHNSDDRQTNRESFS